MYTRDKTKTTDFFKPLNKREKDRLHQLWRRAEWLKQKAKERDDRLDSSANLYRREYSAILWAHDYITEHNKKIENSL